MKKEHTEEYPWVDKRFIKISKAAEKYLGLSGRMLYPSKRMKKPTTIFNANIFNARAKKIWLGDIEIERDKDALLKISKGPGPLYVLWEMDGRFLEHIPSIGYVKSMALVTVKNGCILYSRDFAERIEILKNRMHKKEEEK